jgi:DMSO/TMAO reductase YedYZ molybdopterin-dependent catalytic subunit
MRPLRPHHGFMNESDRPDQAGLPPSDPAVPIDDDQGRPVGRRIVLGMIGLGALGVVFGKRVQDAQSAALAPVVSHDPTGLTDLLPAVNRFHFYNVTDAEPQRGPDDYKLTIGGLVNRPTTLSLADLQAMPQTSLIKDFQCVTGWRVPQVHWSGVALPDVLDHVGVQKGASAVRLTSFDGTYTESLTLDQARRRDVLVALQMLGAPVTRHHGGPVRLYVAPMYGYKSCKWLGGIELTSEVQPGYWENEGYDVDAWVGRSNGRDDAPTS